ncbi:MULTISPECIES: hypothetical protein [unclassified Halomonas]|uniref:hypothetical protein n=1 Tax=unclassified Halomonas TaxID=2609666 RepID=UPI0028841DEB|nr:MULTISPECIES: hypothetical protein [unclassified Halomonas]MDT0501739.1 hypothetical protein [Halomonas sp. PAR7]MDT0513431.1 hypothetical protein [Halomonas sp. LES1]MDT0591802.1 hypothetical protein [Halomonas sp. PAR8]
MEEFDDYRGLLAEQRDFDISQMFHAGLAFYSPEEAVRDEPPMGAGPGDRVQNAPVGAEVSLGWRF